jgi:hypothetical protein
MSSFINKLTNPKTGKKQKCFALDDYYGPHRYGYGFPVDGSDAQFNDFGKAKMADCDFYNDDEIKDISN